MSKNYGGKTKKFYGGKTKKIYGGETFKLRRLFANTIGKFFCPYPLVRDRYGKCTRTAARDKKTYNNHFNDLPSVNPYNMPVNPYRSKTRSKSRSNTRSNTKSTTKLYR